MQAGEITKLMAIIATEYPRNFEVSKERIKLWLMILGHAGLEEASRAVGVVLSEARPFPPQVGEINQAILQGRIEARAHRLMLEEQARLRLAPPPEPVMDEQTAKKCAEMLRQCVERISKKKSL